MTAGDKSQTRKLKLEAALRANLRRRKQTPPTDAAGAENNGEFVRRDRGLTPQRSRHQSATKPADGE